MTEARGGRQSLPTLLTLNLSPKPVLKKVSSGKEVHFYSVEEPGYVCTKCLPVALIRQPTALT